MNAKLKILRQLLQKTIDDIDAGNSKDDDESINAAIDAISTLNNGIQRYSKRYLCDKVLHCSESCFNTYLAMGLIPDGYKEIGFKELRWSIKDMDKALEYRQKH